MKLWQKIFVCYYRFQERIGNGDIQAALDLKTLTFCNIVICCLLGVWFYLKHLRGYRLKETLSIEISLTDKVIATVFVIGSILCLCAAFAFMWAVNNGFILERS